MQIIKYDDVLKIASFLKENGYDKYGLTISSVIETKDMLNKINEDFYYRIYGNNNEKPMYSDEINISVEGINFNYILKNGNDN